MELAKPNNDNQKSEKNIVINQIMEQSEFLIIGGGLTGSLLAINLAKLGHSVKLFEKRPDMRLNNVDGGRSINLALSHRGLLALERVDLIDKITPLLIPMRGRLIHTHDSITFQPYGKDDSEHINSVSRGDLNKILLDAAERYDNVELYFEHSCEGYDNRNNEVIIKDPNGELLMLRPQALIAADGAMSAVRESMLKMGRFDYSQSYMDYGYKELEVPASSDNEFQLASHGLHIWPRDNFVMIALPNPDKTFTLTLFAPFNGKNSFEELKDNDRVEKFFEEHFSDVFAQMPTLVEDMQNNPTGRLVTMKSEPWNKGKAVLIGDAAHAIIPFYGQGMNAGFEDVRILTELIETGENWQMIITEFSKMRKPNTDAIARLSYDNFIEMRDGVADEDYLARKAVELKLYDKYNDVISKYAMVTFHPEMGYAMALRKADILEEVILEFQQKHGTLEDQHLESIHTELVKRYSNL